LLIVPPSASQDLTALMTGPRQETNRYCEPPERAAITRTRAAFLAPLLPRTL